MILPDGIDETTAGDMPRDELVALLEQIYSPESAEFVASLLLGERPASPPIT